MKQTLVKKLLVLFLMVSLFLQLTSQSYAYVSVKGYYRSNGTYVKPYVRSNPNGIKYDNYGYSGGTKYNKSYYSTDHSNDWYQPSYNTDTNYYYGKSLYNSNQNNYNWDY